MNRVFIGVCLLSCVLLGGCADDPAAVVVCTKYHQESYMQCDYSGAGGIKVGGSLVCRAANRSVCDVRETRQCVKWTHHETFFKETAFNTCDQYQKR